MRSILSTTILFAGILAMIFSGLTTTTSAQGQIFLSNEVPNFIPTQQQQQQGQGQLDPSFMSFEQFLQYMFYYKEMFGEDYVTKIYNEYKDNDDKDDDDDDKKKDKDKKKHYDKDWWKHNSVDLWKDKKKYCEGKGEFKNGKCVTDNEEDKTAWEDAVCDNNPSSKSKLCKSPSSTKDKDNDEEKDIQKLVEEIDEEEQQQGQEESKQQDDEELEQESESNDEEEDDSDEDDDDNGGEDDSDEDDDDNGGSEEE